MSDVHANPAALEVALRDAQRRGCGRYLMLGDTTGYGYDVKTTLFLVKSRFNVVLMGNHDSACLGLEPGFQALFNPHYDIDREQREELTAAEVAWLRALPYKYEENDFVCVHSDIVNPRSWGYIFGMEDAARNFFHFTERILFCGHSHHAAVWELSKGGTLQERLPERLSRIIVKAETVSLKLTKGSRYIVNVGSVGNPRNDICSVYCIYDDETQRVTWRRLPFDFVNYIKNMHAKGLDIPTWLKELLCRAYGRK